VGGPDSLLIERAIKKIYEQKNVIGRELRNAAILVTNGQ
jgi:hypothetical protein